MVQMLENMKDLIKRDKKNSTFFIFYNQLNPVDFFESADKTVNKKLFT